LIQVEILDGCGDGNNMIDGGSHFYDVYETKDGKYVCVGSLEPQFYRELLEKTGLSADPACKRQFDRAAWPALQARLAAVFKTRTRTEWDELMLGSDGGGIQTSSQRGAPHVRRDRRRHAGGSRATLQPHGARDSKLPCQTG
jgi:alpha-methylacyl-CoA racemase